MDVIKPRWGLWITWISPPHFMRGY